MNWSFILTLKVFYLRISGEIDTINLLNLEIYIFNPQFDRWRLVFIHLNTVIWKMNFDSSPVQNDHQVLSVRSNKQGCNQLFGFNNVKRNNSTQLDSQNLQPDSTFGSRLGSIRGLADRIKRFYSMQFDDQVRKGAVTRWNNLVCYIGSYKFTDETATPRFAHFSACFCYI